MKENRSWVGHHDFANSGEIRREAEINQDIIESKFEAELNHFRMEVARKLDSHGALSDGTGLALFQQEVFEPGQPSSILQTMIYVTRNVEPATVAYSKPSIRIITNELINTEGNDKWMVIDFTADEVDDTQYFVGVFDLDKPDYPDAEMIPGSEKTEQRKSSGTPVPLVPLFNIVQGEVILSENYQSFTPAVCIPIENGRTKDDYVAPFGSYDFIEHRVHALTVGSELFSQVADIEPIHISRK